MARGWESKAVEGQIDDARADRDAQARLHISPQQREQQQRRQSLLLSRSQVLSRLKVVSNPRYRAQLELALKDLDTQLQECESAETKR